MSHYDRPEINVMELLAERDKLRADLDEAMRQRAHWMEEARRYCKNNEDACAEVERLRALDKEAKSAFAPWVQGPGVVGGILHLQEEVERLRAEANARAVEELTALAELEEQDEATWKESSEKHKGDFGSRCDARRAQAHGTAIYIRARIAELSKPAAKESEPSRCAERVWASGDMEACGKPLPCGDHTKPEEEPDWTVTLAAQANVASVRADKARLLTLIVEGLCNLGREVRRGGKS